jgi:hypothetical protein
VRKDQVLNIKRLLTVLFVLSAGMTLGAGDGGSIMAQQGEIEAHFAAGGSYETTTDIITGYVLYYPQNMTGGHPIITWGNGTWASPSDYAELLSHLASWGFVVIASGRAHTHWGTEMVRGVDYLIEQNSTPGSIFYGKLDVGKIGATGHSQGGIGTTRAAIDPRVTCSAPLAGALTTYWVPGPILLMGGAKDLLSPPAAVRRSFLLSAAPTVYAIAQDMNHMDFANDGKSCRGYLTAWFMYLLQEDAMAAQAFVGDCEICTNSNWKVETKNFDAMPVPGKMGR